MKNPRWCVIAAVLLSLATAGFVIWQNSRVAVLWDLGYLLDTSWRIALGQVPYRDFAQVHAPLTFLTQAILIKIFGRHFFIIWVYAASVGAAATLVSRQVLTRILGGSGWLALLLTAPLVFVGIYGIYPHPIYDCDCGFWILIGIWLLVELEGRDEISWMRAFVTGAAVVLPIFFKQNIGLPFAGLAGLGLVAVMIQDWRNEWMKPTLAGETKTTQGWNSGIAGERGAKFLKLSAARVLMGMIAAAVVAAGLIQVTVGVGNYLHWTMGFAALRRMPGLSLMATAYREPVLWWALPSMLAGWALLANSFARRRWAQISAVGLMAAPFVWTLVLFFVNDDADDRADSLLALWPLLMIVAAIAALIELRKGVSLARLVPFFLLAAIHGSFMSQQLWGSTYGIWPLFLVLIAGWLAGLPNAAKWIRPAATLVISSVILFCGGFYAVSLERLQYINQPDGGAVRATLPVLRGMATAGPYIANFEELVNFAEREIPAADGIMLLPGEDPFYFATGRVPRMSVLLIDPATDPYSAAQLLAEARRRNVRWVIAKEDLQSLENPMPEREETMRMVGQEYRVVKELSGYEVWKRINQN